LKDEAIWSIVYLIIGIGLHYFEKFRDKEYLKKKGIHEQFLKENHSKTEFNIRKTDMEMFGAYNRWLPIFKWFFWLGAIFTLYRGFAKMFNFPTF
jgi:hypothetical protein